MSDVIEMHLKLLFDLDNLLDDMEEPVYKEIGFKNNVRTLCQEMKH